MVGLEQLTYVMPFDTHIFDRKLTTKTALEAVNQLGQLAGYLLNDRALQLAGRTSSRPALGEQPGCCHPVIAVRNQSWQEFLLPAFPLPLQWQSGNGHDPRLPSPLLKLADRVRDQLAPHDQRSFSLGFSDRQRRWADLRSMTEQQFEPDSCFVSLAVGLQSLIDGIAPNRNIWASATWNGRLGTVELLEQKLQAARMWGATTLFVSADQPALEPRRQTPSASSAGREVQLHGLASDPKGALKLSLAKCFAASYLEPDPSDWEACRHYHKVIREFDSSKATTFYEQVLFGHIIELCRKNLRVSAGVPGDGKMRNLVTIATRQPQPIPVIAGALGISNLLVLYTTGAADLRSEAEAVEQIMGRQFPACQVTLGGFEYDPADTRFPGSFVESLRQAIFSWPCHTSDGSTVYDIDRGLTLHKLALLQSIIQPENLLVSLMHDVCHGNRIRHGSEQLLVWKIADGLSGRLVRSPTCA